jgi:hypothetical protein
MAKITLLRYIVIISGFLSLIIGVIGIFVPVLPTTPFILLAAMSFAHSSPKLYNWMIKKRYFGKIIQDYRDGKGLPASVVYFSISFLWVMILISVFFATEALWLKLLLIAIAIGVSVHILSLKHKK